ncbi:hypothetical protein KY385_04895 [Candidatus Parcubacteria bacterium]|nr:hypothetical protein [Candidatus Parcubacteria bacterium]
MKKNEKLKAVELRKAGHSIKYISRELEVAKSSVSLWVRSVEISFDKQVRLKSNSHSSETIEKRRASRLENELAKRNAVINEAKNSVKNIDIHALKLIGVMLYWAEGGKTQRLVRFSNGDPEMIKIMMAFFRQVCIVPEAKFRGYIHIHPHLDYKKAEQYWSELSGIPLNQFFKTYRKKNISSQNLKNSLPYGVFDIYVMDTKLFYKIIGWSQGIFKNY